MKNPTETESSAAKTAGAPRPNFPGRLVFYHPNGKGSGAAARFELRLNGAADERYTNVLIII